MTSDNAIISVNEDTIFVSVHISKTGGTTLTKILKNHFGDDLQLSYAKEKGPKAENPKCIHGHKVLSHFPNIHKNENSAWFTFIREPLATAISSYNYIKTRPEAEFEDKGMRTYLTHSEKPQWPNPPGYTHNRYVRNVYRLSQLNREFDFIGITERFDESIFIMFWLFQWDHVRYKITNRGNYTPPKIEDDIVEKFNALNQKDYTLYRQVNEKLDQLIESYGSSFEEDFTTFKEKFVKKIVK